MKNILKKIVVLALVATMTIMPSATVLAAATPTAIVYTDSIKYYDFRPDPYILETGKSVQLDDIFRNGGYWEVPAFKTFRLKVDFQGYGNCRLIVYKTTGGTHTEIMSQNIGGISTSVGIGGMSVNQETYKVVLVGIDNTAIYGYCGYYE